MNISLRDVQETALIPPAIRADDTDIKAVEIIKALGIDTKNTISFSLTRELWHAQFCLIKR